MKNEKQFLDVYDLSFWICLGFSALYLGFLPTSLEPNSPEG